MAYGNLKPPKNLVIDFRPSPKQYRLWKLLQPDYCPHCGGHIVQVQTGYDVQGNAQYKPQCANCGSQNIPQLILGGGSAGGGKALGINEMVLTPNGFRTMGSIKRGDILSTPDGGTAKVIAVHPQGKIGLWELKTNDGIVVKCCADHIWKVNIHDKIGAHEIITDTRHLIQLLSEGAKISIPLCEPVYQTAHYDSFIHPYIIGFLIGDGGLTCNITFTTTDKFVVDKIVSLLPEDCTLKPISSAKYGYSITNKKTNKYGYMYSPFKNEIRRLRLNCNCHHKRIPEFILNGSYETRLDCVRGLMDSDGYVDKRGHCSLSVCNEGLANDFLRLVRSLGAKGSITLQYKHCIYKGEKKTTKSYTVRFNCGNKKDFVTLPRRLERIPDNIKVLPRFITSIDYVGKEEAKCITIDSEDGMFITNDYLPTHNSYIGSCWIISSCIRFPDLRAVIARKTIKSLKESTFNTIKAVMKQWGLKEGENYKINNLEGIVTFWNGSTILLKELEDLPSDSNFERLGSSEWTIGFVDEVSEISERAIEVLFSRLRWKTHETFKVPRLLMTTNPCITWVRSRFVQDDEGNPVVCKEGEAYVPFSVFDNPDVAFRQIYEAALNKITDPAVKARLLYGNWDFIDSNDAAAYWNFNGEKHLVDSLREKVYDPLKPLILSWDFNVAPFMSTLAIQVDYDNKKLYVLEEILGKPDNKENNTPKLAQKLSQKYLAERHMGGILVTGDPAGLARSTQTEEGVNNYTIILSNLHSTLRAKKQLLSKQPPQTTRLEFINNLLTGFDGWEILIDMRCRKLTEDLIYQKKNEDGTKNKSKITDPKLGVKYEKYGHLSDALDYAICLLLSKEWKKFQRQGGAGIATVNAPIYGTFGY